jgi:predicted RNA-binding Zn ribbon-like protein
MEPVARIDYLAEAEPAPGRLAVLQAFLNTVDREHGREMLHAPERLGHHLASLGLLEPGARVSRAELRRALELREALLALALANNGAAPARGAERIVERAAEAGRLAVRFADGVPRVEGTAPGVAGALATLAGIVAEAVAAGTWSRFKACRRDVCGWAFYDRSRNRSARWCDMAVCGNRAKTKAYRARRRTGSTTT